MKAPHRTGRRRNAARGAPPTRLDLGVPQSWRVGGAIFAEPSQAGGVFRFLLGMRWRGRDSGANFQVVRGVRLHGEFEVERHQQCQLPDVDLLVTGGGCLPVDLVHVSGREVVLRFNAEANVRARPWKVRWVRSRLFEMGRLSLSFTLGRTQDSGYFGGDLTAAC